MIINISKKDLEPKFIPFEKSDRNVEREVFNRVPSIEKARQYLNYKPIISLEEGIKELILSTDPIFDWAD